MLVASVLFLEMNETTNIEADVATAALEISRPAAKMASRTSSGPAPRWLEALAKPGFAVPALVVLGLLLFVVNLGAYPLYTKGEPREAVTVLDIATGGGVILPMRAGVEIPSKPLLMHWLAALLALLFGGVNEWTVRLPSAVFAIAGVVACYWYVRCLFDARSGLIAALILATTIQYLQAGSGARVDMTLTFFMEVAFFEFLMMAEGLTRRKILLYVALAMAVLTKGPVAVVLPGAVALVWIITQWRWRVLTNIGLGRGVVIVLVLAGWWYVAATIVGGWAFIDKQILAENFLRFTGGASFHQGHVHRFYFLELALMGGFMPWTPFLALVLVRAARAPRKMTPRLIYLLVWLAVVLLFYSLAHSKRGVYLLALYPALAAIIALYLSDAIDSAGESAAMVNFFSPAYGAVIAIVGAGALFGLALLWIFPSALSGIFAVFRITDPEFIAELRTCASSQLAFALLVPALSAALGVYLFMSSRTTQKLTFAMAAAMVLIVIGANAVVVPAIARTLSLEPFATDVLAAVEGHSVGYLEALDYDVAFYSRRNIPIIKLKDPNKPDFLICWEDIWKRLPAADRAGYRVLITSNPTDLDNSGRMVLVGRVSGLAPPAESGGKV